MKHMQPPSDAINLTYNGTKVPPEGMPVLDIDVDALLAEGWTLTDDADKAQE